MFTYEMCKLFGCTPSELGEEDYETCKLLWVISQVEAEAQVAAMKRPSIQAKIKDSFKRFGSTR